MKRVLGQVVLGALAVLVLASCGDERGAGDSGPRAPVVHLIDRWSDVHEVQSDILDLEIVERLTARVETSLDVGEGWRSFALPWPAHGHTVNATVEGKPRNMVDSRDAATHEHFVFVPSSQQWLAEDLQGEDREVQRPVGPEPPHVRLRPDESLELALELSAAEAELLLVVRPRLKQKASLRLFLDDEELPPVDLGSSWDVIRRTLNPAPGRRTLRLLAETEGADVGLSALQVAAVELRQNGPDRVLVKSAPEVELEYQPRLPQGRDTLIPARERPNEAQFLSFGGPARIEVDASITQLMLDGEDLEVQDGVATTPSLSPGLHRVRSPDEALNVARIEQAMARLLPFLLHPTLRLRDDLMEAGEGPVPTEIADRILTRLESRHDVRASYWLPAPSVLRQQVEWQAGDRLRFSVGIATVPEGAARNSIEAVLTRQDPEPLVEGNGVVEVRFRPAGGEPVALVSCEVSTDEPGWQDQEIDIGPDLAGTGVLEFETTTADGSRNLPVAVADPRIVVADAPPLARPNLLVYLIDTLRADGLSCYGGRNPTSPRLDELAERGYLFEEFQAVASWTRPTTATIMTAMLPSYHGITSGTHGLPTSLVTLAEVLRAGGYSTWAGVSNVQVSARGVRFDQGFHRFLGVRGLDIEAPEYQMDPSSRRLADEFLPWLERNDGEPFFLYLHSMDPHMPYVPPADYLHRFTGDYDGPLRDVALKDVRDVLGGMQGSDEEQVRQDVEYVRNVYDAEVSCQDDELGRLFDELERLGHMDDTIVVILSDHGEEFYEHGRFSHQGRMWDVHLKVPLVIWIPERWRGALPAPPVRVAPPVSQTDLLPSLLELVGLEDPAPRQGRSFVSLMRNDGVSDEPVFCQEKPGLGAVRLGDWKLIWREDDDGEVGYELFHLGEDPGEQVDLSAEREDLVRSLWQKWQQWQGRQRSQGFLERDGEPAGLSHEELEELRALGYAN